MAEVEWIKIRVNTFEDEKIRLIEALPEGDTLLVIWLKMLTHAGKINDRGYIYLKEGTPYTPQMLSIVYNRPQPVIDLALKTFQDFGMIEIDERGIRIVNWEKHQNIDGLERIRQQTRERVRKYREKQKQEQQLLPEPEEGNVTCNDTVTDGNAVDKEIEEEIEEEKEKEREKEENNIPEEPPKKPKKKRPRENLCSIEDIESFVGSQMASNPLSVNKKLLIKYIDCLRLYRKTARVSAKLIKDEWEKWQKYHPDVVTYAMWIHIDKHDDKPEEYTRGIMKKTSEHEARRGLLILKNRSKRIEEEIRNDVPTPSDESKSHDEYEKYYI